MVPCKRELGGFLGLASRKQHLIPLESIPRIFADVGDSVMLEFWRTSSHAAVFLVGRTLKSGELVGGPGKLDFAG